MPNPRNETVVAPFTAFNFAVEIDVANGIIPFVCNGAFQECDGLEINVDIRTIREGGNNSAQIRLAGPTSYGQLTLKRGMTETLDLWDWVRATQINPATRATAVVVLLAANGQTERLRFVLDRCVPVKLKLPALNAREGGIAIEELQLAYESLTVREPSQA
jgi:phage tail-like protein